MNLQTRRTFLGRALLAGAGTTLLQAVTPGDFGSSHAEAEEGGSVSDLDPGFVAGRVLDLSTSEDLTIQDPDSQFRRLRLSSLSQVWKQGQWNQNQLKLDDCLYVRGELDPAGVLEVDRVWVNIKSFPAEVTAAGKTQVAIVLADGTESVVQIVGLTEVEKYDGSFASGDASHLASGDVVQAVGFGDPMAGNFIGSRVLLLSTAAALEEVGGFVEDTPEPDLEGSTSTGSAQCIYKGLTTWFCCGGVTGCGAGSQCPGNTKGGACGGCRSDRLHMAWPKLKTGCGPFCDNCCVAQSFPRRGCGADLRVRNPCNGNSTNVTIKDCGPQIRCVGQKGCNNYRKLKFDLTPCAFTKVGNLDTGIINCHATGPC